MYKKQLMQTRATWHEVLASRETGHTPHSISVKLRASSCSLSRELFWYGVALFIINTMSNEGPKHDELSEKPQSENLFALMEELLSSLGSYKLDILVLDQNWLLFITGLCYCGMVWYSLTGIIHLSSTPLIDAILIFFKLTISLKGFSNWSSWVC